MLVGYARTSTVDQIAGFEAQVRDLEAVGCVEPTGKVYQEQRSAVKARPELDAALDFVREGDTLIVTKLDRLARSITHLCEITARLKKKKVGLRVLALDMDTNTPTGKALLGMLGIIAELERDILLERQRDGITKARTDKKYRGRVPVAKALADKMRELAEQGFTPTQIARKCGVSRTSVYRVRDVEVPDISYWSKTAAKVARVAA